MILTEEHRTALMAAVAEGEALLGFNVFEVEEAKVALDQWYQKLLTTLKESILTFEEIEQEMTKVLEEEEKVLYTGAIRTVVIPLTDELETARERLEKKVQGVLEILKRDVLELDVN